MTSAGRAPNGVANLTGRLCRGSTPRIDTVEQDTGFPEWGRRTLPES